MFVVGLPVPLPLLLPIIFIIIIGTLLWGYYDQQWGLKKRKVMQSKQETLLREGRAHIDKGLKIEEIASSTNLSDDPVYLSEARK